MATYRQIHQAKVRLPESTFGQPFLALRLQGALGHIPSCLPPLDVPNSIALRGESLPNNEIARIDDLSEPCDEEQESSSVYSAETVRSAKPQ